LALNLILLLFQKRTQENSCRGDLGTSPSQLFGCGGDQITPSPPCSRHLLLDIARFLLNLMVKDLCESEDRGCWCNGSAGAQSWTQNARTRHCFCRNNVL